MLVRAQPPRSTLGARIDCISTEVGVPKCYTVYKIVYTGVHSSQLQEENLRNPCTNMALFEL